MDARPSVPPSIAWLAGTCSTCMHACNQPTMHCIGTCVPQHHRRRVYGIGTGMADQDRVCMHYRRMYRNDKSRVGGREGVRTERTATRAMAPREMERRLCPWRS